LPARIALTIRVAVRRGFGLCQIEVTADGAALSCTFTFPPMQVHVRQLVDGGVVLDKSVTPVYAMDQPNGPGCGPICREGGADWT